MTALAGLWAFDGREVAPSVPRMLKAQSIYGHRSASWSAGEISLGRHLFQILPEDSRDLRPQIGADGTQALVADVRLDNRAELASLLGISPNTLQVTPDASVLMRALEVWGEAAVTKLVGDFAFAWWDARKQTLLLARDYLGQRPLHYHRGQGFFAFASMPKGLHALPGVPFAADTDSVASFIALIPEGDAASFFKGVERVRPGHFVRITRDGITSHSYWRPPTHVLKLKDNREYEEAVRTEMDRAVASRLRGVEGKVGAHLSGGLDSTTVASTAARFMAGRGSVVAYTSVPRDGYAGGLPDSFSDEWRLAAAVAALHENIEHVKILASGSSPFERLDRYFYAFDRPMLNLCNSVWSSAIMDDARSRNLGVLLTGDAGNLSFSFDGMIALPQMLRELQWVKLARTAFLLVKQGSRLGTVASQIVGPFLPRPIWRAISRLRGKDQRLTEYTLINPELEAKLKQKAATLGLDFSYRPRSDADTVRVWALRRVDVGNYHKGYLGVWGLDVRDPTADRRLVELCLTIPAEQFLAGGVPRSLARRAFTDRLPGAVYEERKKGYQAADWHEALSSSRSQVAEEIERCSRVPEIAELISTGKMQQLLGAWPDGAVNWNDHQIIQKYRLALMRGTSAAHFVRKASGSNS